MGTGAAYHGHHQVSDSQVVDGAAYRYDLAERLMPKDQILRSFRRPAVLKAADLSIGAADTYLEYAKLDLGRFRNLGLLALDQADLA
jgi:hypothetical protein